MCGIAGFVGAPPHVDGRNIDDVAASMAASLAHRGPDDNGIWIDAAAGTASSIGAVDRRSFPAGHQPMVSADGRFSSPTTARSTASAVARELAARG